MNRWQWTTNCFQVNTFSKTTMANLNSISCFCYNLLFHFFQRIKHFFQFDQKSRLHLDITLRGRPFMTSRNFGLFCIPSPVLLLRLLYYRHKIIYPLPVIYGRLLNHGAFRLNFNFITLHKQLPLRSLSLLGRKYISQIVCWFEQVSGVHIFTLI